MSSHMIGDFFENMHTGKMATFYILLTIPMFWAVTPGSENQKDPQRNCDQFPSSGASRSLF